MTRKARSSFIAAMISFVCVASVAHGQSRAPEPRAIVKKMIAQYEGVSSYQDSGIVRVLPGNPSLIVESNSPSFQSASFQDDTPITFTIYYAHPRMFRFEWKSSFLRSSRQAVIWTDGEKSYSWTPNTFGGEDGFALHNVTSLRFNVEEAIASSGGSVILVPSLLMRDITYSSFAQMLNIATELSIVGEAPLDGEICYVIRGNIMGTPWALWIGKKSSLLRKTRTLYSGGSFHEKLEKGIRKTLIAEEIHRNIRINEKIPKKVFKYKPQLQAHDVDFTH